MKNKFSIERFWEAKIIGWETNRYGSPEDLSFIDTDSVCRNSLQYRMAFAYNLLKPYISGKHILELGCGSGLLAPPLLNAGAASYTGYDIAESAITRARELAAKAGLDTAARFEVFEIGSVSNIDADIIISLGLLDWLSDRELEKVFSLGADRDFLHSISERRSSLLRLLHRVYCFLSYGYRTRGYVPRYYAVNEIKELICKYSNCPLYVYRNQNLSFGALLSSLPIGTQLDS